MIACTHTLKSKSICDFRDLVCTFAFLGTNRELGFFLNPRLYNCKEKLVTSPFVNRTYDMNYFLSFTDEETMEITFALVERVQNLKLDDLETAVVAPLVVMQTGK